MGGGVGVEGDFEEAGAAPDGEGGVGGSGAVGVEEGADSFSFDEEGWVALVIEQIAGEVGDAVAEAIDVDDAPFDFAVTSQHGVQRCLKANGVGDRSSEGGGFDSL